MNTFKSPFLIGLAIQLAMPYGFATPIQDPIADYLAMQVPDRLEYVGTPEIVKRVKIDVDGDGKNEVFIGTCYKYSGSKEASYWSAYKEAQGGSYDRITPANADIWIPSFEKIYAGNIPEISKQGLVYAFGTAVDNPKDANITGVEALHYYSITNNQLVDADRGALNLSVPADKTIYDRYFGPNRQTRVTASDETFTAVQLQQMGYTIPNWEPLPP